MNRGWPSRALNLPVDSDCFRDGAGLRVNNATLCEDTAGTIGIRHVFILGFLSAYLATIWRELLLLSLSIMSDSLQPHDCSTPGFPVLHYLPEFAQTHVHWVSDAIQPSHPLSSLSPLALNLSQPQGLFQWVSSIHRVAKVLEFQLQHQSF